MHTISPILLVFLLMLHASAGYFVTIEPNTEECFFERAEAKSKLGLTFEVIGAGSEDIDIRITDPAGGVILHEKKESSIKSQFPIETAGIYTCCFIHKKLTVYPRVVMFSLEVSEPPHKKAKGEETKTGVKMEDMVEELSGTLTGIRREQEYMSVRDKIHRTINESTNSLVVSWSAFEAVLLCVMTFCQVFYLKRFFEIRMTV